MNDFRSLDTQHKCAVICYIKSFRLAIECLTKYVPTKRRESVMDEVLQEASDFVCFLGDEEVDKIIEQIEKALGEIDNSTLN